MTTSRASQVSVEATPYYHCVSRCVRRAFLCGEDAYSGKNFDHRKPWVVERLRHLASVFAIDVCAYAVMSNHLHLVVRLVPERAARWSDEQVVKRYAKLFRGAKPLYEAAGKREQARLVSLWRARLCDLSWTMRSLNEWIARRANNEDGCKGRFWEGRFKSQALLDTEGLLTCMAYVDLNPVRAGAATSLEGSDFTSIQERLRAAAQAEKRAGKQRKGAADARADVMSSTPAGLAPFADDKRRARADRLPIDLMAYLELLQWTGRALRRHGSRARLQGPAPGLLRRLGFDGEAWLRAMQSARHGGQAERVVRQSALGCPEALQVEAARREQSWVRGKGLAVELRSPAGKADTAA